MKRRKRVHQSAEELVTAAKGLPACQQLITSIGRPVDEAGDVELMPVKSSLASILPRMSLNDEAHPEPTDSPLMVPNIWVSDFTSVAAPSACRKILHCDDLCVAEPFGGERCTIQITGDGGKCGGQDISSQPLIRERLTETIAAGLPLSERLVEGTLASVPMAFTGLEQGCLEPSPPMFAFSTDFQSMRRTVPAEIA